MRMEKGEVIVFIGSVSEMPPGYTYTTLYCNIISYFSKDCQEILVDTKGAGLILMHEGKVDLLLSKPLLPQFLSRIQSRQLLSFFFFSPLVAKGKKASSLIKDVRRSALKVETLCGKGKDLETCSSQLGASKFSQASSTQERRICPPSP